MRKSSMMIAADGKTDQQPVYSDESVSPISSRRRSVLPPVTSPGRRTSSMGMGIAGLLTSKKFGKKPLVSRNSVANFHPPEAPLQPTYRMSPTNRFVSSEAYRIIKDVLNNHLDGFQYNSKFCQTLSTLLSDDIKDQVKRLNFGRHKIVVNIVLGERKEQGVMVCSRCAWDVKTDTFATYTYKNKTMFCTASVYGVYME
ncbi:hypothetical protein SNE40_004836 [Patella caerulea]|uniref:Uncharacterized protein n=1 Tax=Patella caerulea TaxID=87958 RepID=A0AAN8PYL5_PATCE